VLSSSWNLNPYVIEGLKTNKRKRHVEKSISDPATSLALNSSVVIFVDLRAHILRM